ncbi:uncharacterized protein BJ171DRAFT_518460 [Polychytrium aggregatum]|uniref:uncharacterized protein n=1 Tax=Polychytrium aggregatum TaxID=110093 RepID=UPI0022FE213A|nr:uncharacterized protein BJ171DRAFT_518460 [Polychytrium aggregatum]KAI9199451.1 hypothetical protein BJ171DRAFT_518460 [Polychytrium aggregatum]
MMAPMVGYPPGHDPTMIPYFVPSMHPMPINLSPTSSNPDRGRPGTVVAGMPQHDGAMAGMDRIPVLSPGFPVAADPHGHLHQYALSAPPNAASGYPMPPGAVVHSPAPAYYPEYWVAQGGEIPGQVVFTTSPTGAAPFAWGPIPPMGEYPVVEGHIPVAPISSPGQAAGPVAQSADDTAAGMPSSDTQASSSTKNPPESKRLRTRSLSGPPTVPRVSPPTTDLSKQSKRARREKA